MGWGEPFKQSPSKLTQPRKWPRGATTVQEVTLSEWGPAAHCSPGDRAGKAAGKSKQESCRAVCAPPEQWDCAGKVKEEPAQTGRGSALRTIFNNAAALIIPLHTVCIGDKCQRFPKLVWISLFLISQQPQRSCKVQGFIHIYDNMRNKMFFVFTFSRLGRIEANNKTKLVYLLCSHNLRILCHGHIQSKISTRFLQFRAQQYWAGMVKMAQ